MQELSLFEIQILMSAGLFFIGAVTFVIGVFVLIRRTAGKEVRVLADQTTKLAQKGLAEEIAGLVGNASALLNALNDLTRTTAGVGIFLTLLGVSLMTLASWLVLQLR